MSLGSNSNEYLSSLINTGSDAMQNLYYAKFTGSIISDIAEGLKVRLQDFKAPDFNQTKNEVHYMTVSTNMPGAGIEGTKSLSLTFRLDSNYKLYEYLLKQQSATMSGNTGWAINQVPNFNDSEGGLTLRIYVFDRSLGSNPDDDECYREIYTFKYCWIKGLSGLSYSYDNASPMTITADIGFMDYDDPMNLLLG